MKEVQKTLKTLTEDYDFQTKLGNLFRAIKDNQFQSFKNQFSELKNWIGNNGYNLKRVAEYIATPELNSSAKFTLLHTAVELQRWRVVDFLLEEDVNNSLLQASDANGQLPLHLLVGIQKFRSDKDDLKKIEEQEEQEEQEERVEKPSTSLHVQAHNKKIKIFIDKAPDSLAHTDHTDHTPFAWAMFRNNTNIIKFLLDPENYSINSNLVGSSVPLLLLAMDLNCKVEVFKILLDLGNDTDLNVRNQQHERLIDIALRLNKIDVLELLFSYGAAINQTLDANHYHDKMDNIDWSKAILAGTRLIGFTRKEGDFINSSAVSNPNKFAEFLGRMETNPKQVQYLKKQIEENSVQTSLSLEWVRCFSDMLSLRSLCLRAFRTDPGLKQTARDVKKSFETDDPLLPKEFRRFFQETSSPAQENNISNALRDIEKLIKAIEGKAVRNVNLCYLSCFILTVGIIAFGGALFADIEILRLDDSSSFQPPAWETGLAVSGIVGLFLWASVMLMASGFAIYKLIGKWCNENDNDFYLARNVNRLDSDHMDQLKTFNLGLTPDLKDRLKNYKPLFMTGPLTLTITTIGDLLEELRKAKSSLETIQVDEMELGRIKNTDKDSDEKTDSEEDSEEDSKEGNTSRNLQGMFSGNTGSINTDSGSTEATALLQSQAKAKCILF